MSRSTDNLFAFSTVCHSPNTPFPKRGSIAALFSYSITRKKSKYASNWGTFQKTWLSCYVNNAQPVKKSVLLDIRYCMIGPTMAGGIAMAQAKELTFKQVRKQYGTEEAYRTEIFPLRLPDGFVCSRCGCREFYPILWRKGLTMQTNQFLPQNRKSMLKKAVASRCGAAVLSICRNVAQFYEKFFVRNLAKHPLVTVIRTEGKNNLIKRGEVIAWVWSKISSTLLTPIASGSSKTKQSASTANTSTAAGKR